LTPLPDLLAQQAFVFGQQGKIAETVGPLYAAERFGGADKISQIANVVAWELADRAMKALADGRSDEAAGLASLGYVVAENIRCLYALCLTSQSNDRGAFRWFARQLIDVADRSINPDRWAVFRFILHEALQPGAAAELTAIVTTDLRRLLRSELALAPDHADAKSLMATLEAAIGLTDPPAPPAGDASIAAAYRRALHRREADTHNVLDQPDLAIAHCAAVLRLGQVDLEDESRFSAAVAPQIAAPEGIEIDRSDEAGLALAATLCAISPTIERTSALIRCLCDRGDSAALSAATKIAQRVPYEQSLPWVKLQFLCGVAQNWIDGEHPAAREARACNYMIAKTDEALAQDPLQDSLRLNRCQFLLPHARNDVILADLAFLIDRQPSMQIYDFMWNLMRSFWESGDLAQLETAARIARRAPVIESGAWVSLIYMCELSERCMSGLDRNLLIAQAGEAVWAASNRVIEESNNPHYLRFHRSLFSMTFNFYKYAIEDCIILFDQIKNNENLEIQYGYSVASNILNLQIHSYVDDLERLFDYTIKKNPDDVEHLRSLFLFASELGRRDIAYKIAARAAELEPNWRIVGLLEQFIDVQKQIPALILERPRRGKNVIYANIVCWGDEFVRKMAWGSLSSLLSPRNIPLLAEKNDIVFDFITHHTNVDTIKELPEIKLLHQYCEIRIYCLPDIDNFFSLASGLRYYVFGHAQHFTVLRAQRDNVDVLLLASDVVNADGNLAFVDRHVSAEPRAIFYDGINCSQTPVRAALMNYRNQSVLTVDARTLAEIAVRNLKPIAINCFFNKSGESSKPVSSMFFFRKPFGFRVYSFGQALVYASAAALRGLHGFDCLPVEGRLSALLLEKLTKEQIVTRKSKEDFLWIELDDNDRWDLVRQGNALVTHVEAVVSYFRAETRHQSRFTLFERGVDCHVTGLEYGDVIDDETEAAFFAELSRRRQTDPIFTQLCFEHAAPTQAALDAP